MMQKQLEKELGAKKLEPNIPLGQQMGVTPPKPSPDVPERAISGDPTYAYGDVSPEEVQAFEQAESKGKAWQPWYYAGSFPRNVPDP